MSGTHEGLHPAVESAVKRDRGPFALPDVKTLRTDFEIKAVLPEQRIIEGFAAVGGNLDRVGDVIESGANYKAAQTPPGDVGVFIGHQSADLPIGRCLELRADSNGLFCKTYIFPTIRGDDLLQTAKALQDAGSALGLSIGYRTNDYSHERRDGKMVRVLKSYQLAEYSFAARQVIANPRALVTGIKSVNEYSREELQAALAEKEDKAAVGSFMWTRQRVAMALSKAESRYCDIVEIYPDRVVYSCYGGGTEQLHRRTYTIASNGEVTLSDPVAVDTQYPALPVQPVISDKTDLEPIRSAQPMNPSNLPDAAFLWIEPGGARDEEGKTVPRSLRHFPYRDGEGRLDGAAIKTAIASIPQADGLDAETRARVQAHARRALEATLEGKTLGELETPEWKSGAAIQVRAIAYRLLDASETIATELKAMALLGSDTKGNGRLRPELRQKLADLAGELGRIAEHAELIDREQDGAAKVAHYRRTLELLEV